MIVLGNVKKLNVMRLLVTAISTSKKCVHVDRERYGFEVPIKTLRDRWRLSKSSVHDLKRSCGELQSVTIEVEGVSSLLFQSAVFEGDSIRVCPTKEGFDVIEALGEQVSKLEERGVFFDVRSRFTLLMLLNLAIHMDETEPNDTWNTEKIKTALNISRNYSFNDLVEHVITPIVSDFKAFFGSSVAKINKRDDGLIEGISFRLMLVA